MHDRPTVNEAFDTNAYWRDRVRGDATLGVVGHRAFGTEFNEFIYRRRVEVLDEILSAHVVPPGGDSVLDIGCGSGFYTCYWHARNTARYLGIDVSGDTVRRLRQEYPAYSFAEADVTDNLEAVGPGRRHSIVTVFDVFYHIVDDRKFRAALRNVSAKLDDAGILIVFDQLSGNDYSLRKHVRFRGRAGYRKALADAGLEIVASHKLFGLLVPPVFGIRIVDIPIAAVYKAMGLCMRAVPPLGRVLGRLLYSLDRLMIRLGWQLPNNEAFVMRRLANRDD